MNKAIWGVTGESTNSSLGKASGGCRPPEGCDQHLKQRAVYWLERVSKSLGQGPRSLGSEYLEVCESLGTVDETPREEQVKITPKN